MAVPIGFVGTIFLILVSARTSREWPRRKDLWQPAGARLELTAPQGRAVVALAPFGIAIGIPAALGLVPGNVLILPGALMACILGRSLAGGEIRPEENWPVDTPADDAPQAPRPIRNFGKLDSPYLWTAVLALSIFMPPILLNTSSLRQILAAQTVLGPLVLTGGTPAAASLSAASASGLIAAIFWSARTPRFASRKADAMLRWSESALAGAAVSWVLTGPALGALVAIPFALSVGMQASASFGVACVVVAAVSKTNAWSARARPGPALAICALLWLVAIAAAAQAV
ncbi:MAG: hypothetical protein ACR2FO_06120 [Actinomycetota bacterium]